MASFDRGFRNPAIIPQEPDPRPLNEFEKGFRRFGAGVAPSIDRTQAAFQQAIGQDEAAQANLKEARRAEEAALDPALAPRIGRVEDVYVPGDFGETLSRAGSYAGSVLGENLPLVGSMAVGGAGAGLAARGLGAGTRLAKGAAWAGGATPYAGTSIAESSRDIMDDPNATGTPQEQALGVIGTGLAKTALGMVPFGAGARMLRGPGGRLAKGAKVGGASAVTEGLTEVGEEAIGQYGKSLYVPGTDMFDEEAQSRYLNALAGGVILGGPTGFGAGVLAPKGLSKSMEHAMQSAVEEGKSPIEGANKWALDNGDLLTDEDFLNLEADIQGFQPQAPRGPVSKRYAQMEADEELDLAYSSIPDSPYHRRKAKQTQAQIDNTAYDLITGKISRDDALALWPEDALQESVLRQSEQFIPPSSEGVGQQISPDEQATLDVQDPGMEIMLNKKGLPWHTSKLEDAKKVARNTVLDELTAEERTSYERSTGKDKADWEKTIESRMPKAVDLGEALKAEGKADGVVDLEAYAIRKIKEDILPAYAEADAGTEQRALYEEYKNNPEGMMKSFGVLVKERVPPAMDKFAAETVKPAEIGEQRTNDLKTEAGIRRLSKDIKNLEDVFENWNITEEAATSIAKELDTLKYDRAIENYKRQGIIHGRQAKKLDERIPVEVFDFDSKRWVERQMNPMAATMKAMRTVKYDPNATYDTLMKQIIEGIGSVLGSRKYEAGIGSRKYEDGTKGEKSPSAIRFTENGINPHTIVFKSKKFGNIQWKDVEKWSRTKDERGKGQDYFRDENEPGVRGDEGPDHMSQASKPLPLKEEPTTTGGLAKEPGPYVPDVSDYESYVKADGSISHTYTRQQKPLIAEEKPVRVISGGQTGADVGGLVGAQRNSIETGGTAPKGYRTDDGDKPVLKERFGLSEDKVRAYGPRTKQNVLDADLTVVFLPRGHSSPGTGLTIKLAKENNKPFVIVDPFNENAVDKVRQAIRKHLPETINIAGPRESKAPGITSRVASVVSGVFTDETVVETTGKKDTSPVKKPPVRRFAPTKKPTLVGPEQMPIDKERREAANKRRELQKEFEREEKRAAARRAKNIADAQAKKAKGVQKRGEIKDQSEVYPGRKKGSPRFDFSEVPAKDKAKVDDLIKADNSIRRNRHQRLANKLAERIGIPKPIILDTKDAVATIIAAGQGNRITTKAGFAATRKGVPIIYVNPTLPEDAAIEVLGHEIGHVVLNETWSKAPRNLKNKVKEEFEAYLKKVGSDPTIYDVVSKRTPQRLLEHMLWSKDLNAKISTMSKADKEYLLKFEEWFADNVAKWIVTDAKPRSLVESFFKHVADMLKDLWSGLTRQINTPEKSIQEYMDGVFKPEPAKTFGPEHAFAFSEVPKGVEPEEAAAAASVHNPSWGVSGDEAVIREALASRLNQGEMRVLGNMVHLTGVRKQMLEFYRQDPVALDALDNSNTKEMIPLAYKAWRAGALKLSKRNESIFMKFMEAMAEVLGIIMNSKNAENLMRAISDGAVRSHDKELRNDYIRERVNETALQQARDVIERMSGPAMKWMGKIGGTAEMRVRWAKNPALTELWKQIYLSPDTAGGKEGFFASVRRTRANFELKMHKIFDGKDTEFGNSVIKILNKETPLSQANDAEKETVQKVYDLLQEIRDFSIAAGVKQGNLGKQYFPRVYDMDVLVKNRDEFIEMLTSKYEKELLEYYNGLYAKKEDAPTKTPQEIAEFIHRNLTTQQGDELSALEEIQREIDKDPLGWPAMDSAKQRSLGWIKNEDVGKFLSQDMGLTLSTYIHQAAKRAEYNRRFGVGTGKKLVTAYLDEAKALGASEDDMQMAHNAMKAAMGTLGADINPTLHKWQGIIMVLENWMLLGLATMTSLVDPMGIAVRGDLETAWASLNQGLREVKARMKGDQTELSRMAGMLGINELHTTVEALGYEYGGYFVTGAARKWNERLFSINLLNQWTRVTRTMALAGARRFLAKHAAMDNAKSERFMRELGLREGDVQVDKDGNATILHDTERGDLENKSKLPWDDEHLEKHYVRDISPTGDVIGPSADEVHQRFNSVAWDTAPKKIVQSLMKKKQAEVAHVLKAVQRGETWNGKSPLSIVPVDLINAEIDTLNRSLARGDKARGKTYDSAAAADELARDERVRQALNRWVDEAILRPDAAQRPIWASDPHWMLVFHLKAFTYSFHERILRRVGHEIMEGNYQPVVMLMGYLPLMYAAEALRNMVQGDDFEDDDFWGTTHNMAQRAGLYGVGTFVFDVKDGWRYGDTPFSVLGGPTVEHTLSLGEAAFTASETDDINVAFRSLPFHNVFKDWFK